MISGNLKSVNCARTGFNEAAERGRGAPFRSRVFRMAEHELIGEDPLSADREALHDTLAPRHTCTRTGFILQIDRIERGRNLSARLEEAHADQ